MPKLHFKLRFSLPKQAVSLFLCITSILLCALIALPQEIVIPLQWVQRWQPNLPPAVAIQKIPIDLRDKGIPFSTTAELRQGLDIVGGTQVTLEADMKDIPEAERKIALESVKEIMRRRVDFFGVSEPRVRTSVWGNQYQIIIELPGLENPEQALSLIGQTAQLQFRESIADESVATRSAEEYFNSFQPTQLDGKKLKRAVVQFDEYQNPVIGLQFTDEGAKLFAELTEKNVGKVIGIYLDDQVLMLPQVNEPIYGGQAQITGQYTAEGAKIVVSQLNAGALPVPVKIVQQKNVGPSLGQESLQKSVLAGVIGLGLVALFMILLYGWAGFIANIGLIAYGCITVALYKLVPITVTLPGIAGLMLSIGMAVDSNILTFERIKEESRAGKPWKTALQLGFGRSWESIKSANLATLTICTILFNPLEWGFLNTSGPIRGFAVTLALGIAVSLFTGVFFSRLLIQLFLAEPKKKGEAK